MKLNKDKSRAWYHVYMGNTLFLITGRQNTHLCVTVSLKSGTFLLKYYAKECISSDVFVIFIQIFWWILKSGWNTSAARTMNYNSLTFSKSINAAQTSFSTHNRHFKFSHSQHCLLARSGQANSSRRLF